MTPSNEASTLSLASISEGACMTNEGRPNLHCLFHAGQVAQLYLSRYFQQVFSDSDQPRSNTSNKIDAAYLTFNTIVFHLWMKPVVIVYLFIRDQVVKEQLVIKYAFSYDLLEDALIKPLSRRVQFHSIRNKIDIFDEKSILREM